MMKAAGNLRACRWSDWLEASLRPLSRRSWRWGRCNRLVAGCLSRGRTPWTNGENAPPSRGLADEVDKRSKFNQDKEKNDEHRNLRKRSFKHP